MKKCILFISLILFLALMSGIAQAGLINSFVNIDFDSDGVTTPGPFKGFDAPDAPEIVGWTNYPAGPLNDAGIEGPGAWWNPYETNAGFMSTGDAAYTMSTYTIQSGDVYTISYYAMQWQWTGSGEWTATLFYDNPANVIGSYVQGGLPDNGTWLPFSDATGIAATPASVGGTLGILMTSTGTGIAQIDELTVDVVPEPATMLLLGLGSLALLRRRKS